MGLKSEKLLGNLMGTKWELHGNTLATTKIQQTHYLPKRQKKTWAHPTLVACMLIGCNFFFVTYMCVLCHFLGNARDPKSRGVWWKHEKTKHETLLLRGGEERVRVPPP